MIKRVVIFFALKGEANSLLNHSFLTFDKKKEFFYAKIEFIEIFCYITGIGKDNIHKSINDMPPDIDLFLKCGMVGTINKDINLLTPFCPQFIQYGTTIIHTTIPKFLDNLTIDGGMLTSDTPLINLEESMRNILFSKNILFVDMETYHLSQLLNINITPIVIGSDYCNENVSNDFKNKLKKGSDILKDVVISFIKYLVNFDK